MSDNVETRYIIKWYIPQLAEWIAIGEQRTQEQAQKTEDHFRKKISENWRGPLLTVIIRQAEEVL